jgi:PAS domain S-box-containing protein
LRLETRSHRPGGDPAQACFGFADTGDMAVLIRIDPQVARIIDALPHPVFYKDRDGVYHHCNRAFAEFLGLPRELIIGRTAWGTAPAHIAEIYHAMDLKLINEVETQVYEESVQRASGEWRRVVFHKARVCDEAGEAMGVVGSLLDVTDLRALAEQLARLNRAMAELGTDPQQSIETLLAYCGELIGASTAIFNRREGDRVVTIAGWSLPPDYVPDIPLAGSVSARVLDHAQEGVYEVRNLQESCREDPHVARYPATMYLGQPVFDGGAPIGVVGIFYLQVREITEHERALLGIVGGAIGREERRRQELLALQNSQQQLVRSEKLASIGQLAAGVAHEINNPVGFVMSNLSTLETYRAAYQRVFAAADALATAVRAGEDPGPAVAAYAAAREHEELDYLLDDTSALLRESQEGVHRVREIVQNLKSFVRVDEKVARDFDVNEGLASTLRMVWNEVKYRCEVVTDFGEVPPVHGFSGELNQVFMNLLVNAAQAIAERGTITIATRREGDHAVIRIADTGCGIPADQVERIFEPFYTTKSAGKGTGLGLSISQAIIDKHGGTIAVTSEIGAGTAFTVRLPLAAS